MKIAFYIHHTTISAGGIYTYTIGILRQLFHSPEINKIIIATTREISESLSEFRTDSRIEIKIIERNKLGNKLRMFIWYVLYTLIHLIQEIFHSSKIFNQIKKQFAKINPYNSVLEDDEVDVFHVPLQYSPIYKAKVPIIVTMHDLQEYHFAEYFSIREKFHRKINNQIAVKDSDQIICSFQHVKNDIVKYLKINPEKVSVCPPPFTENWFLSKDETQWEEISNKYRVKKNYMLYPAATWKHKNHTTLICVMKRLKDEGIEINLVCTGNKTEHFNTIQALIEELQLSDVVYFLGIVSEEDLIGLYKNTSLVVIPTLYEAGSGPLYEAMRYGVPVICSNVTSLPETINNDDFLFDPRNVDSITERIYQGITDNDFRKRNIENSKRRIEEFKKIDYAKNFLNVYAELTAKKTLQVFSK